MPVKVRIVRGGEGQFKMVDNFGNHLFPYLNFDTVSKARYQADRHQYQIISICKKH